jgi:antitoxin component of RelBE/YafQ-DinJ toxin-antitoxin module
MVLGWKDGNNSVIDWLLEKVRRLEERVILLENQNSAQKQEISKLTSNLNNSNNSNISTEWRDMLIGKRKNISENQINILSAVGCEQKNRQNRERNVVLFGVPNSTAATEEEREKEDEKTTREILEEIGLEIDGAEDIKKIRRIKSTSKKAAPTNPLPIRVCFGELHNETYIRIEEVLKKSKSLKDSQKYKKVFINRDLTVTQIIRLKQLIKTRNEENLKLDAKHKEAKTTATYRYGIRNDMVVKVFLGKI